MQDLGMTALLIMSDQSVIVELYRRVASLCNLLIVVRSKINGLVEFLLWRMDDRLVIWSPMRFVVSTNSSQWLMTMGLRHRLVNCLGRYGSLLLGFPPIAGW